MRFSTVAVAAMAAGAQALSYSNATYVTEVVTALTTVCPSPTQITYGGQTYTVTKATTLTITNCPCTITRPVVSSVVTSCATCTPAPPPVVSTKGSPAPPPPAVTSAYVPPPYANGTTPAVPSTPVGTGKPTTTSARATFTGAANKAMAASGAGLAGLFAAVAYVL